MSNTHAQSQIGNIDLVKQLNSAAVYRLIDQHGPISRIQIAEESQLAPASVTKITRQLLERGLIKEVEQQASTGGRRAISIVTETRPFHTIGIRLGRHDATIALFDMSARMLVEEHYFFLENSSLLENGSLSENTQQQVEKWIISAIEDFMTKNQRRIRELVAISIILPGLVDLDNGIIRYMPHIKVDNWALEHNLRQYFNISCFVGHDIRSFALAEHYFGATRHCEDSILVRVHRGTGAGIIVSNNILLNQRGNLGEIGHIQIDTLGERCHCGNFGCLETVVSNPAIEARVQHQLRQGFPSTLALDRCNIHEICLAANQGDSLAVEVIRQAGHNLGKAIAIAINFFNPQKIVIAGDITEAESILLTAIQNCINTQSLKGFRENLPVVVSELDHCSAIGAFALTKHAMLNGVLLQHLLGG
ncbi:MAG: ROK family transcriptional regulator [Enterobacteriaceae bacterium]|jgi:N-acetylglucosamine repressor|nr:ROK family transcriptional regulator [Enterobacteriaceae bacterium]